eukprot:SAG22_NODE_893_length_6643_cov_9.325489_4_plen_86_part_00
MTLDRLHQQCVETITIDTFKHETIDCVKHKVQLKAGIPADQHVQLCNDFYLERGGGLEDGRTVYEFNIEPESTLHLMLPNRSRRP